MEQSEKRRELIRRLLDERSEYRQIEIPADETGQRRLLRSLFNVRAPEKIDAEFLRLQDDYLQEEIRKKGVTELSTLSPGVRRRRQRRQCRHDRMLPPLPQLHR